MRRREFLTGIGSALILKGTTTLEVAYAGSLASVMEGPIRQAAKKDLGFTTQGRAQGASGLAQLIVSESIRPDVFISITPSPMDLVVGARKATKSVPIARTEMVIAYSPIGRFAQGTAKPWWQVLREPGLRFGRTDPATDPQGRNIIFVMQLAARYYNQPDLVPRVLGSDVNSAQIFTESSVQARLQSGQLDAASAYKVQPAAFGLPYVTLPKQINLSGRPEAYNAASLTLNGKTYRPEPLIYYAAALTGSSRLADAARFVEWLQGESAQNVFRSHGYDPPASS